MTEWLIMDCDMEVLECPECGQRIYTGMENYNKHRCFSKFTDEELSEYIKSIADNE